MQRRFFNLNIKHPHWNAHEKPTAAEYWLNKRSAAPVFFGPETVEEVRNGLITAVSATKAKNALLEFLEITEKAAKENFDPIFVTIDGGTLWLYRPIGPPTSDRTIEFKRGRDEKARDTPKIYAIEMLTQPKPLAEVPYVLASIKSNQAFSRGTFSEIGRSEFGEPGSYRGNIAAIQSIIGWETGFRIDPLECLSSIELETLVAKVLEESGFHVPAHRGGVMGDIDLFAYPTDARSREFMNRIGLDGNQEALSIQVKLAVRSNADQRKLAGWLSASKNHLLITLDHAPLAGSKEAIDPRQLLARNWIKQSIRDIPRVNEWVSRSLSWIPDEHRL